MKEFCTGCIQIEEHVCENKLDKINYERSQLEKKNVKIQSSKI